MEIDNFIFLAANMDKVCRTCLTESVDMTSIFEKCKIDICAKLKTHIAKQITECTNVQILPEDALPTKICQKCLLKLHASIEFQHLCVTSDRTLRRFLDDGPNLIKEATTKEEIGIELVEIGIKEEPNDVVIKEEKLDYSPPVSPAFIERQSADDSEDQPLDKLRQRKKNLGVVTRLRRHPRKIPNYSLLEAKSDSSKRLYVRRKPLTRHACDDCGKVFSARKHWVDHIRNKHGVSPPERKTNMCDVCEIKFSTWNDLKIHQKELGHYLREECSICKKIISKTYMPDHMRGHLNDKPFLCTLCGRSFLYQFRLREHTLLCTKAEKHLKCSYCDRRFYSKSHLTDHEKIHSGFKEFVCETCGKGFLRKHKLTQHRYIHTNERPYACKTCGNRFRQSSTLKSHIRIHTGDRPYVCNLCPAAFTQGHCLKTHKKKHMIEIDKDDSLS